MEILQKVNQSYDPARLMNRKASAITDSGTQSFALKSAQKSKNEAFDKMNNIVANLMLNLTRCV